MRENRLYGSEGGVAKAIPTPIRSCARRPYRCMWVGTKKRAAQVEQRNSDVHEKMDRTLAAPP
jgi:hypothetical protein